MMTNKNNDWRIYRGQGQRIATREDLALPEPPPWRVFSGEAAEEPVADFDSKLDDDGDRAPDRGPIGLGETYRVFDPELVNIVNAALYLRRPLFLTGKPGTGKSTLAYSIAWELRLGSVLYWPINTRTTLKDGLYRYDAIGRLHDASLHERIAAAAGPDEQASLPSSRAASIGHYLRLGPLGTALLPAARPRVLLIDEIDKGEIDLPNDLLHVLERGQFEIDELVRIQHDGDDQSTPRAVSVRTHDDRTATIRDGKVTCSAFPFILMTSNGEREFPAPFFRRCLRHELQPPNENQLAAIVTAHLTRNGADALPPQLQALLEDLSDDFCQRRDSGGIDLAVDQLMNATQLLSRIDKGTLSAEEAKQLRDALFRNLSQS